MSFNDFARVIARRRSSHSAGLVVLRRTESTHLLARRIAREYSEEGSSVPESDFLAWQQTAGRGRGGRSWSSPPGAGIYATLIRQVSPLPLQMLPLLVATALCEALNVFLRDRCRLEWPNDPLVDGRKLGGVLIDAMSHGDSASAVISFGVNHGRDVGVPGATSVEREAPGRTELPGLAAQLVEVVDGALESSSGVGEITRRYRGLSVHQPGEAMRCRVGSEKIEGVFRGFDRNGFLRLEVGGEERLLTAGEVEPDE